MSDTRAEWLAWRTTGIGASDVAGILGLSPWSSPFSVWASKVDTLPDFDTDAMEFGRRAEVMVALWFEDRTGLRVTGAQERRERDGWKLCTLDGLVCDGTETLGPLEIKTTSDPAVEWFANGVPVHYKCQATWTMHVTDLPVCWFAVLHLAFGRPRFEVYQFARDADDEAFVVAACERFWADHVQTGTPPPADHIPATTNAIKAHWPTAEGSIEADASARRLVERLRRHKATLTITEQNVAAAENELRILLGDKEALVDDGAVIASWKPQQAARIDTSAMKAAHPDLCAEFTTTTTTRVLRVPKEKQ